MKRIMAIVILLVMACPLVYAAATTATVGGQNASQEYTISVDAAGVVTFASDSTIVDTALYSENAGSYPNQLLSVGEDGTIYGKRTTGALVDLGLYTGTGRGVTGQVKYLCISVDGSIYANNGRCQG